jgi:hypothetical protein
METERDTGGSRTKVEPQVGMILVHGNAFAWKIVGVGEGNEVVLEDAMNPDSPDHHSTFDPEFDTLYPDLTTAMTVTRLLGGKLT